MGHDIRRASMRNKFVNTRDCPDEPVCLHRKFSRCLTGSVQWALQKDLLCCVSQASLTTELFLLSEKHTREVRKDLLEKATQLRVKEERNGRIRWEQKCPKCIIREIIKYYVSNIYVGQDSIEYKHYHYSLDWVRQMENLLVHVTDFRHGWIQVLEPSPQG